MKKETVAFYPGKFFPHWGHIMAMIWLLSRYDKLVVGIGSCYEVGSWRHPILAIFRQKMITLSLLAMGVDMGRIEFVHLEDFQNWDIWWSHIMKIALRKKVTHFATGNELILDFIKPFKLPFKVVNPEKDIPKKYSFKYHSTDMKRAAEKGNLKLFYDIAAYGTIEILKSTGGIPALLDAMSGNGAKFVYGRQAVDLIVLTETLTGRLYVLTGFRKKDKDDFPGWLALPGGGVNEFESPLEALLREPNEETGIGLEYIFPYQEPAVVRVADKRGKELIADMQFVGMFGSKNPGLSGSKGGSSQVSVVKLNASPMDFNGGLTSDSDLERVAFRPVDAVFKKGLAYQQEKMLRRALKKLKLKA